MYDGLEARSQNRWPSLAFDLMAVNSLFSPLFAAVLPTLETSQVRPRDPWWPEFQRDAGEFLAGALRERREPPVLAAEVARLYHDHREATS